MYILPLIVYIMITIVFFAMIARMILWLVLMFFPDLERVFTGNIFYQTVFSLSEPMIAPFRSVLPTISRIDIFSFVFASIILQIVRSYIGMMAGLK